MNKDDSSGVGRQVHLPLRRAFKISLDSLRIRFWRSTITAGGIFLGIAFLSSVIAQDLLQWPVPDRSIGLGTVRLDGEFTNPSYYDVWKTATVGEALEAGIPMAAIEKVAEGDEVDVRELSLQVQQLERSERALVTAKERSAALRALPSSIIKGDDEEKIKVQQLKAQKLAPTLIKDLTNNTDIKRVDFLAAVDKVYVREQRIEANIKRLEMFRFDKSALQRLQENKRYTLAEILEQSGGMGNHADAANIKIVNTGGRSLALDLAQNEDSSAASYVESGDLVWAPDAAAKSRRTWLVIMSLLVCTVGITNSMLMSVTERFKEIGTMKCLGALDKFVVELFLMEAGLLGLAASFAGWLIGVGTISLAAVISKGFVILTMVSVFDMLRLLGMSLLVGMSLTMLAACAPAIRAAQMPPAAALRAEI